MEKEICGTVNSISEGLNVIFQLLDIVEDLEIKTVSEK